VCDLDLEGSRDGRLHLEPFAATEDVRWLEVDSQCFLVDALKQESHRANVTRFVVVHAS
jgi:hypothetical protein